MKRQLKTALFWFGSGLVATAIILIFVIVGALLTDKSITLKTFWLTYLIFGVPFAISAISVLAFPEWYEGNDVHACVMGFVSIWGAPVVKLAFRDLGIGWCFLISVSAAFFVTHYLRIRKKAGGTKGKNGD